MMAEADLSEWDFGSLSDGPAALVGGGPATSSYLDTEGDAHIYLFSLPACLWCLVVPSCLYSILVVPTCCNYHCNKVIRV